MSPPLISEYKKSFAARRLLQTFFGGPNLWAHPVLIVIQIVLFSLPAILLSVVDLAETTRDLKWRAFVVTVSMILMEFFLNFLFFLLKRGHQNIAPTKSLHNLLEEEDENEYEGLFRHSTWVFIAPNSDIGFLQFFIIVLVGVSFGACTPIVFSPATSGVLQGFAIFALCVARYSAVVHLTPEIATFDPIRKTAIRFYRSFYVLLVGVAHAGAVWIYEVENNDFYFGLTLALLPLLWLVGILPPVDSIFPWALETMVRCFGGVPSHYYFGTLMIILVGVVCSVLALVASSQNPVLYQILECIFGYLLASDIGSILNARAMMCEDVPATTALQRLFRPVLAIMSSVICVLIAIVSEISEHYYEGLASSTLTIAISSWWIRLLLITRKNIAPKPIIVFHAIWDGMLTFILHTWITIEVNAEVNQARGTVQGFHDLFRHMLTIRAFSAAICYPKMMTLDMVITSLYIRVTSESSPHSSFVVALFVVSLLRQRFFRLLKLFRMVFLITHAFITCPLLNSKWKFVLAIVAASPISFASLLIASCIEGCTLVPLFTLPIFIPGFLRPVSFWKEKWFPDSASSKQITGNQVDGKSLDWTIYAQLAPALARNFVRKVYKARMSLEEGQGFLARYEDRLVFLRIMSAGWNYVYVNVKGLEMQEQTSCHHQEAAKMDELFEKSLSSSFGFFSLGLRTLAFSAFRPEMTLMVPTYAESKSTLYNLQSKEETLIFQSMFYRAFSYLWIKKNPAFKGESYQRPIASGYHFMPPGAATIVSLSPEVMYEEKESDDDDLLHSSNGSSKDYSVPKALANVTMFNVSAVPGAVINNGGAVVSPYERLKRDAWSASNGMSFPMLPGMDTSFTSPAAHDRRRNNALSRMSFTTDRSNSVESDDFRATDGPLSPIWVRKCVGESIPSNAVKARVERLCSKVWRTVIGREDEVYEIDLCQFFVDEFWKKARQVTTLSSRGRISVEEITVKSMRYAAKLALDEIYSGGLDSSDSVLYGASDMKEEEIFYQLSLFEKNHKFSSMKHIPTHIDDRQKHIVSMSKTDDGQTQMKMLNFDSLGVEFRVGRLSQLCVEGIWGTLNLELLYLTSDDDERFSIQNDSYLLRNICTQCANSPLGYAVYDGTFKINQYDNTVVSMC